MDEFQKELTALINIHSMENASNTPDFLIAEFLVNCLRAFNLASEQKEKWFAKEVVEYTNGPASVRPLSEAKEKRCLRYLFK